MNTVTIPNRPFSSDIITGLMLPDGIFEATLGKQNLNAHFTNSGSSDESNVRIFFESGSHPAISVTPFTHNISTLASGSSRVLGWNADFSGVPAGTYFVSFIVETNSGTQRVIKKIFVTRVQFDSSSKTFQAETPEGLLEVRFQDLISPNNICCRKRKRRSQKDDQDAVERFNAFGELFSGHNPEFEFCPPGYLPLNLEATVTPKPPFNGQYGDLPFEDPWWKVLLCIITVILLIAAAIVAAETGGSITVTGGTGGGSGSGGSGTSGSCCGVSASGSSSSYVVAGLVAAAAAAATIAAASDVRDPVRRGQDNTLPNSGELTVAEKLKMTFVYPEPIALGKPFMAGLKWEYTRVTDKNTYTYSASDMNKNIHVLSEYKIEAPEVVRRYQKEKFEVRATFIDGEGRTLKGNQLFVQCFLSGPNGEFRKFLLQDDGVFPDRKPSDGIYTGEFDFLREEVPEGLWRYFVIAQDVNHATPDMKPEEAAQIIGGLVITHQLVITFDDDECPFVPDGHVNVI